MISLPYFDLLFEGRRRGTTAARVFDRFVHWGYWERPAEATGGAEDLVAAMDRLNALVVDSGGIRDGQSVLDAGCGFGGTLASINETRRGMSLTGVNIDKRQIAVAESAVRAGNGNTMRFVEGDACALPFPNGSFDRVLAVECIFHFPSRLGFLREAARVLKPGGMLALSDFVPIRTGPTVWPVGWVERQVSKGYGTLGSGYKDGGYAEMARAADLEIALDRDITANTLPTYPVLIDLIRSGGMDGGGRMLGPTRLLQWLSRLGILRYRVLAFSKP